MIQRFYNIRATFKTYNVKRVTVREKIKKIKTARK